MPAVQIVFSFGQSTISSITRLKTLVGIASNYNPIHPPTKKCPG